MKPLESLNPETIKLLHKNNLLKTLIKNEVIKLTLSDTIIEEKVKSEIFNSFLKSQNLTDTNSYKSWLDKNYLENEDVEEMLYQETKLKQYYRKEFSHKANSRFLERKDYLDVVVYSLIRVSNSDLARELYLRVLDDDDDFGETSCKYSEGPERNTRGIVGPVPIEAAHPALAALLRQSKPGKIQAPLQIDSSFALVRLEYIEPAKLNQDMKDKMSEELFILSIEEEIEDLNNHLLNKTKISQNITVTS